MRISPSQISAHRACARRYAWEYGHGFRSLSTPAQERGTAIHAILEDYLNGKGPIDATTELGAIAQAGIPYLPDPGTGHCEQEFSLVPASDQDFSFFGKIDFISPSLVLDHKTLGNWRYMKSVDTLSTDPQAVLYAKAGYTLYPDSYSGDVRYIYYLTAQRVNRQARKVEFTLDPGHVEDQFVKVSREAENLVQIRTNRTDPLSLPPNLDHCNEYGGCPHKGRCTDLNDPKETLRRIMLDGKDDLLASLMRDAGLEEKAPEVKDAPKEEAKPKKEKKEKKLEEAVAKAQSLTSEDVLGIAVSAGINNPDGSLTDKYKEGGTPGKPILFLYVDCLPSGVQVTDASIIFSDINKRLAAATQVPHYKMIEYGKGPGVFAEAVREYVEQNVTDAHVFLDSRSLEGSDALTVLTSLSFRVVRAVR